MWRGFLWRVWAEKADFGDSPRGNPISEPRIITAATSAFACPYTLRSEAPIERWSEATASEQRPLTHSRTRPPRDDH